MDERFIGAVESVYAAALDPSRWPHALQAIANCIDGMGANLFWRRDDGSFGLVGSTGMDPRSITEYHERWWREDIRGIRAIERAYVASGNVTTDRHLVSDEELDTHPFFTEFLARYGQRWVAAVGVSPDPHVNVAISVHGASARQPFSDEELNILGRLGAHAEKALRLSIRLLDAELTNVGLGHALARIGIGIFVIDSLGRVLFSNPKGELLLGDGLEIEKDRLRIGAKSELPSIDRIVAMTLQGDRATLVADPMPILIHRSSAERPLVVYLLPIRASVSATEAFLTHARAIVLVIEPESGEPPDPAIVRDVLGLTLAEARVAALVGSGLPPRAAAEKLGITEETARTALKRVFSKVGVSRQNELTALLSKLVLR